MRPKLFKLWSVADPVEHKQVLRSGGDVDPKSTRIGIVRKDVYGKSHVALAKPDEPTPVLLIRLDVLILSPNGGKQLIDDNIAADAAVIDVLIAIYNAHALGESDLVGHV